MNRKIAFQQLNELLEHRYDNEINTYNLFDNIEILINENQRLIDLLIYALLPKKIYDHELSTDTMDRFREVISNNLSNDTHTLRWLLEDCWHTIGKENQSTIFDYLEGKNNGDK